MAIGAAIGGVASSLIGASSAKKAARAQTNAANQQMQIAREQFDTTRADLQPFRDAGGNALAAYNFELGLGARPDGFAGISMSPGTTFALEQGRDTIEAGAAARSGLNSGATLAGLERLRFGLSAQDRETQLNRLGGLAGMGQSAAAMNAANSSNFTQNATGALGAMGNAQAAGAIGFGNALQGGLQNLASSWGYQSAQMPQNSLAPTTSLRPQARPF